MRNATSTQSTLFFIVIFLSKSFSRNTDSIWLRKADSKWKTLDGTPTVLFGHRGENVLVPGHTLPSYELAAILGAEFIEPDLVLTKDNVLVCHHDIHLNDDTDIATHPEFKDRKRNYSSEDSIMNAWFIQDFTLAELKTLRVIQAKTRGISPSYFNSIYQIPTFAEFLDVVHKMTKNLGRSIGIIPELKNAAYHNHHLSKNFMENQVLDVLSQHGYSLVENDDGKCAYNKEPIKCPKVIIQSSELPTLEYFRKKAPKFETLLLAWDDREMTYGGVEQVSKFANYYCIWKKFLQLRVQEVFNACFRKQLHEQKQINNLGGYLLPWEFTKEVHKREMKMCLFTIYDSRENGNEGCEREVYFEGGGEGRRSAQAPYLYTKTKTEEMFQYFNNGIDALFVENTAESKEIKTKYESTTC